MIEAEENGKFEGEEYLSQGISWLKIIAETASNSTKSSGNQIFTVCKWRFAIICRGIRRTGIHFNNENIFMHFYINN